MLSDKDCCDYDTCVALHELGFKGRSSHYYDERDQKLHVIYRDTPLTSDQVNSQYFMLAVHLWDAQKWLREVHNLHIEAGYNASLSWYYYHVWESQDEIAEGEAFPTYEDALNTAIYMATEFLKEKK